MPTELETRAKILAAVRSALLEVGYASLSTRRIAEVAGVPLSQIHYHFGSKQNLVLELLEDENSRRLSRQTAMYESEMPLWKQWVQACDFLEDDLESGYVRVLQEMTAAGWSDPDIARAVGQALPQLLPFIPPKRRCWKPEHYRMSVFKAAAAALTYLSRRRE